MRLGNLGWKNGRRAQDLETSLLVSMTRVSDWFPGSKCFLDFWAGLINSGGCVEGKSLKGGNLWNALEIGIRHTARPLEAVCYSSRHKTELSLVELGKEVTSDVRLPVFLTGVDCDFAESAC